MKYTLMLIFLAFPFCVQAADGTNNCNGERAERLVALQELGKFSQKYVAKYGKLPRMDIFTATPKEFETGIPQPLQGYYITEDVNSVGYMCILENLNPKKIQSRTEICEVSLTTLKTGCAVQEIPILEFIKEN